MSPPAGSVANKNAIESYRLDLTGYSWQSSQETLVVVVRYTCPYCRASLPFYGRLIEATTHVPTDRLNLIFVSPDNEFDALRAVPGDTSKVSVFSNVVLPSWITGTPTVLIVNRSGVVKKLWTGKLDVEQERALLKLVEST